MPRILIIDDSKELLEILEILLQTKGYEIQTAATKNEASAKFLIFNPEIVLLDVKLNGEDGRQICREMKVKYADKKMAIFLLSASPELLLNFEECNADGIIEKPFDIKTLFEKIGQVSAAKKFLI